MGEFFSITTGPSEVPSDDELAAAGIATKDTPNVGDEALQGSVPVNSNAHQFRMQVGSNLEEELQLAEAQEKINLFGSELERIEVLAYSGEPVTEENKKYLRGTMGDITIAWVDRAGGDVNDPEIASLRARVGAILK